MEKQTLCFTLLLLLMECFYSEENFEKSSREMGGASEKVAKETLVKTIGKDPDSTPICTNNTLNFITMITCKIRTERGEDCRLVYRYRRGFENNCSSKFSLMTENQTFFLHLKSLTPEDGGIFSCECVRPEGTFNLYLNVSVKDSVSQINLIPILIWTGSCAYVLNCGLVIGFIIYRTCCRNNTEIEVSGPPPSVPLSSVDEVEENHPYESLHQTESDVYQTISLKSDKSYDTETGEDGDIYENFEPELPDSRPYKK